MDITQITRLEEQGETLALHSGIPLSLQDPEKVWVVLEGKLDLYLVEMREGEPTGARHHFIRVEAGNPVMGFEKLPDAAFGVIANPAVGSKVLRLQLKQLQQAAVGSPESVLPLIDKWVENLGSAMADKSAPKNFHILTPGTEILVEGKPAAILPLTGVVWVRHQEGSSCLLGDDQMPPIEPGKILPGKPFGVATVRRAGTREMSRYPGLAGGGPAVAGLAAFSGTGPCLSCGPTAQR